jgi:hypothetical protein
METLLSLMVGLGLSAACGFRVFVPLTGMSLASLAGHLTLAPGFEWIGTVPACLAFTTATCLEIGTYYIPWLDNFMDALMTPVALIAGSLATASMVDGLSPLLQWSLGVIGGGGVAGLIQGGTVTVRASSSGTTGGAGNPVVSTLEMITSVCLTVLALLLPLLALLVVFWICWKMLHRIRKSRGSKPLSA